MVQGTDHRKKDLQEIEFLLEVAARCLHRAHRMVDSVDGIGRSAIDHSITGADEALYLVKKEISRVG